MTAQVHAELTADGSTIVLVPDAEAVFECLPSLKLATPLFKPSKPKGAILAPAAWATAVQLVSILGPAWRPGPRLHAWLSEQAEHRTLSVAQTAKLRRDPPEGRRPRPYQVEGAVMIGRTGRALLFDEQGTGKTITAILGIVERAQVMFPRPVTPVLCVVPASVVDNWLAEWAAWAPDYKAIAWRGTAALRHALAGSADVYVAGYEIATRDAGTVDHPLVKIGANMVVADECHFLKSATAMRSKAVRRLARRSDGFIGLSGTPITHNPGDLWPTLEGLEPLVYPSKERFVNRYCNQIQGDYKVEIIGLAKHREAEFRTSLLGQHRRVAKDDVLDQLPPKIYSVRHVELPAVWRKAYDRFEADMLTQLPDGDELGVMDVLSQMTFLSRLASAGADVDISYGPDIDKRTGREKRHIHLTLKAPCWKAEALLEILAERPGSPVVAFTPSSELAVLAGQVAEREGFKVGYVIGGQPIAERTRTVERFQDGQFDLLAATTGAGGVGLTLTAAGTVVFLQRPWSLVEALQAEDRCHRIGSEIHDVIEVIDIVATNTVEDRVRDVLRSKAGQLSDLLQDPRIAANVLGGKGKR